MPRIHMEEENAGTRKKFKGEVHFYSGGEAQPIFIDRHCDASSEQVSSPIRSGMSRRKKIFLSIASVLD